jgi:hypothetical protein
VEEVVEFLDYLARATPLVLVLAGLLAFYYREKIKQILSRSVLREIETLKKDFGKELAEHSAQLQRDIESYKVGLIAEAERAKATQEVKKSLALRMAERKFNALTGLLDAHIGFDTSVIAHVGMVLVGDQAAAGQAFASNMAELMKRYARYSTAADAANAFLSVDARRLVLVIKNSAIQLLVSRADYASDPIPKEDQRAIDVLNASIALDEFLRGSLQEMERLD